MPSNEKGSYQLPASLFVSGVKVVERPIELADGSTHIMWFRILPNSEFERYAMHRQSLDEDVVAMAPTRLVSKGLCSPTGEQVLSIEQADELKREVMLRIASAILDVNGQLKPKTEAPALPNASTPEPTSGSGTSSL